MPLKYEFRKNGMFPIVACNKCKQAIRKASKATVQWNEDGYVVFACKGPCTDEIARAMLLPYWEELDVFLACLTQNTGLDLKKTLKRHDYLKEWGLAV